jgi:hypothetical protein
VCGQCGVDVHAAVGNSFLTALAAFRLNQQKLKSVFVRAVLKIIFTISGPAEQTISCSTESNDLTFLTLK